jgi:Xaa-Pro aminopeptidase
MELIKEEMKLKKMGIDEDLTTFLSNCFQNKSVGIDSELLSVDEYQNYKKVFSNSNIEFIVSKENLVDTVWEDRKIETKKKSIFPLGIKYTGKKTEEKIDTIREKLKEKNADSVVISQLDEIAWTLNMRGSDIIFNPVFFSYLIIDLENIYFFVDENKFGDTVDEYLKTIQNV